MRSSRATMAGHSRRTGCALLAAICCSACGSTPCGTLPGRQGLVLAIASEIASGSLCRLSFQVPAGERVFPCKNGQLRQWVVIPLLRSLGRYGLRMDPNEKHGNLRMRGGGMVKKLMKGLPLNHGEKKYVEMAKKGELHRLLQPNNGKASRRDLAVIRKKERRRSLALPPAAQQRVAARIAEKALQNPMLAQKSSSLMKPMIEDSTRGGGRPNVWQQSRKSDLGQTHKTGSKGHGAGSGTRRERAIAAGTAKSRGILCADVVAGTGLSALMEGPESEEGHRIGRNSKMMDEVEEGRAMMRDQGGGVSRVDPSMLRNVCDVLVDEEEGERGVGWQWKKAQAAKRRGEVEYLRTQCGQVREGAA